MPILPYPGENDYEAFLQQELTWNFAFARRLYAHWLPHEREKWLNRSRFRWPTLDAAMIIDLQICRQFRSLYDECSRGEAICAAIITRSLFESILALLFVLKPRLYIVVDPEIDKSGAHKKTPDGELKYRAFSPSRKHPKSSSAHLPRHQRASMYLLHRKLQDIAMPERLHDAGMKRLSRTVAKNAMIAETLSTSKAVLGPEWTYILKSSMNYSGLSVSGLADLFGPATSGWYKTIYAIQSGSVHANEPSALFIPNDNDSHIQPSYFSMAAEVKLVLNAGIGLFLAGTHILQDQIGFGELNETVLSGFTSEYKRMRSA